MTLSDLDRLSGVVNITWLSRAIGLDRTSLSKRMERRSPEITPAESDKITAALAEKGLAYTKSRERGEE